MMYYKLKYGNTNTFIIYGTNANLLIDTDYAGKINEFYKEIKQHNIKMNDITYVLATHYHPDHIGLISELQKQGAKLLLVDIQYRYIHFSDEIFNRDKRLNNEPINADDAIIISCDNSREFLKNLGIDGEIISTSSHSEDSVSLILDSGECFVGDLEPIDYLKAYDENKKLDDDWKLIISYKPKVIYYAHANEKIFNI